MQFREAGNVPLQELLKREEEAEIAKQKKDGTPTVIVAERKSKGLSMKAPSFLFKKRSAQKKSEKDVEEKEDN
jgi:hypothetical protein